MSVDGDGAPAALPRALVVGDGGGGGGGEGSSTDPSQQQSPPEILSELKRFYFNDSVEAIALVPAVPVPGAAAAAALPSLVVAEQGNCYLHRV